MTRRPVAALAGLALALVVAACGGQPSAEERRAALVADLAEDLVAAGDGALDEDAARCVAERLADDVGPDRFDEVLAAAEDPDAAGDLRDQVVDAFAACDALDPLLEGD